mmetsp:Transcript_4949/g.3558  ORF Transcript_4949/g.3558 Transcript_4949/m.3558 type:complete len:231 (+) Transcript_4949:3-695(+)
MTSFKPLFSLRRAMFNTAAVPKHPKYSYQHTPSKTPFLNEHISERLRSITEKHHSRTAMIFHEQGKSFTYEELNREVEEVAKGLVALGLEPGDRVGIYSPNRYEWLVTMYACARANLITVNVNPAFQEDELEYCLNQVGVKTLVMPAKFKSSNYIQIVKALVPELESSMNPLNLGKPARLPSLKSIVMMDDLKEQGMINFKDLYKLHTGDDALELSKRENSIYFEDVTNI